MDLQVLDNIVPIELLNNYNQIQLPQIRIRCDVVGSFYNTFIEYGDVYYKNIAHTHLNKFVHKEAEDIWSWFKTKTQLELSNLDSCYVNSMSFGDEGYAHIDGENITTCIFYMNDSWHSQWSGETVFYSGNYTENYMDEWYYTHDIVKSVLPKYGRLIIFDGSIPHSVRPLSKKCLMTRTTFMLKLINTNFKDIIERLNNATK